MAQGSWLGDRQDGEVRSARVVTQEMAEKQKEKLRKALEAKDLHGRFARELTREGRDTKGSSR